MAEISIDLITFVKDTLDFIFKRNHLDERYDFVMSKASSIPQKLKSGLKDSVNGSYWTGKDSYFFFFNAKDVESVKEEDNAKISSLFKSGFHLSEDSSFSSGDVYKGIINGKDNNPEYIYFVVKVVLH